MQDEVLAEIAENRLYNIYFYLFTSIIRAYFATVN